MRYRKNTEGVKTKGKNTAGKEIQEKLASCLGGVRYKGDVNLTQAFVWNVRTCRLDVKREIQADDP